VGRFLMFEIGNQKYRNRLAAIILGIGHSAGQRHANKDQTDTEAPLCEDIHTDQCARKAATQIRNRCRYKIAWVVPLFGHKANLALAVGAGLFTAISGILGTRVWCSWEWFEHSVAGFTILLMALTILVGVGSVLLGLLAWYGRAILFGIGSLAALVISILAALVTVIHAASGRV